MDNLGDWIYIIVIAIAGIISFFNSAKKNTQKQEMPPLPPKDIITTPDTVSEKDFWETITERMTDEPVIPKPPKRNKKSTSSAPPPLPFLKGESEIERIIRQQEAASSNIVEEEIKPLVSTEDFHNPDALRKAVIYSEILNRKY